MASTTGLIVAIFLSIILTAILLTSAFFLIYRLFFRKQEGKDYPDGAGYQQRHSLGFTAGVIEEKDVNLTEGGIVTVQKKPEQDLNFNIKEQDRKFLISDLDATEDLMNQISKGDVLKGCSIDFQNCSLATSIEILQVVSPFVNELHIQKSYAQTPEVSIDMSPNFESGFERGIDVGITDKPDRLNTGSLEFSTEDPQNGDFDVEVKPELNVDVDHVDSLSTGVTQTRSAEIDVDFSPEVRVSGGQFGMITNDPDGTNISAPSFDSRGKTPGQISAVAKTSTLDDRRPSAFASAARGADPGLNFKAENARTGASRHDFEVETPEMRKKGLFSCCGGGQKSPKRNMSPQERMIKSPSGHQSINMETQIGHQVSIAADTPGVEAGIGFGNGSKVPSTAIESKTQYELQPATDFQPDIDVGRKKAELENNLSGIEIQVEQDVSTTMKAEQELNIPNTIPRMSAGGEASENSELEIDVAKKPNLVLEANYTNTENLNNKHSVEASDVLLTDIEFKKSLSKVDAESDIDVDVPKKIDRPSLPLQEAPNTENEFKLSSGLDAYSDSEAGSDQERKVNLEINLSSGVKLENQAEELANFPRFGLNVDAKDVQMDVNDNENDQETKSTERPQLKIGLDGEVDAEVKSGIDSGEGGILEHKSVGLAQKVRSNFEVGMKSDTAVEGDLEMNGSGGPGDPTRKATLEAPVQNTWPEVSADDKEIGVRANLDTERDDVLPTQETEDLASKENSGIENGSNLDANVEGDVSKQLNLEGTPTSESGKTRAHLSLNSDTNGPSGPAKIKKHRSKSPKKADRTEAGDSGDGGLVQAVYKPEYKIVIDPVTGAKKRLRRKRKEDRVKSDDMNERKSRHHEVQIDPVTGQKVKVRKSRASMPDGISETSDGDTAAKLEVKRSKSSEKMKQAYKENFENERIQMENGPASISLEVDANEQSRANDITGSFLPVKTDEGVVINGPTASQKELDLIDRSLEDLRAAQRVVVVETPLHKKAAVLVESDSD